MNNNIIEYSMMTWSHSNIYSICNSDISEQSMCITMNECFLFSENNYNNFRVSCLWLEQSKFEMCFFFRVRLTWRSLYELKSYTLYGWLGRKLTFWSNDTFASGQIWYYRHVDSREYIFKHYQSTMVITQKCTFLVVTLL